MLKPITSAMAAVLLCLAGTPALARVDPKPQPPIETNHIVEMPEGFAICTCGSPCSAQSGAAAGHERKPAAIRIGANVRLDLALIPASATKGKAVPHAQ